MNVFIFISFAILQLAKFCDIPKSAFSSENLHESEEDEEVPGTVVQTQFLDQAHCWSPAALVTGQVAVAVAREGMQLQNKTKKLVALWKLFVMLKM